MSLYRRYRPQNFSEIIGQNQVSDILLKQLETGKISHAYLFSGPRGTGKTSTARIFAKAINCEKYAKSGIPPAGGFGEPCNKCSNCLAITEGAYLDVMEIDAASNRGIDEIRDLREKIKLAPTAGRYKVYIIDEVHMLTNEAFNALLKTLEEPPEHAIFIMATTEPHKIPLTILSRSQKFEFRRPEREEIKGKLLKIKHEEKININDAIITSISELADGAFRDAEVLLEKINSLTNPEEQLAALGRNQTKEILNLLDKLLIKDTKGAILWLEKISKTVNLKTLNEEIIQILRSALLVKVGVEQEAKHSPEDEKELKNFSLQVSRDKLTKWINLFSSSIVEMKDSPILSLPLELAIIEACEFNAETNDSVEATEKTEVEVDPEEKKQESEIENQEIREEVNTKETKNPETKVEIKKSVKKTSEGTISIEEVQKNWTSFLNKIKIVNNSLEIFLRSSSPIEVDDSLLILEVGYRFHKDRLEEPKNSEILSKGFEEILGKPVRIKAVVNESRSKPAKTEKEQLEEADPVEIFGKLN